MRFRLATFIVVSTLLVGCASTPPRLWINNNGNIQRCTAYSWGWGLAGIAAAGAAQRANLDCARDLERLGYVPYPHVRTGLFFKDGRPRVEALGQGSPAEVVGILVGDVVLEADGSRILGSADFARVMNTKRPGDTVSLKVDRNGQPMTFLVGIVPEPGGD